MLLDIFDNLIQDTARGTQFLNENSNSVQQYFKSYRGYKSPIGGHHGGGPQCTCKGSLLSAHPPFLSVLGRFLFILQNLSKVTPFLWSLSGLLQAELIACFLLSQHSVHTSVLMFFLSFCNFIWLTATLDCDSLNRHARIYFIFYSLGSICALGLQNVY